MSQSVTLRLTDVTVRNETSTVTVTRTVPEIAILGISGPIGGYGAHGSFYDTATHRLTVNTATRVPLNTTEFASFVSIVDGDTIKMANEGRYNIAFSIQLRNDGNQPHIVSIWLLKNTDYVPYTATDIVLGKSEEVARHVAAWNFFVDAQAGDEFALMVATDGTEVDLIDGASILTTVADIPMVPSTIVTVNQIG